MPKTTPNKGGRTSNKSAPIMKLPRAPSPTVDEPPPITWHYDPSVDMLDKYGDYHICTRPPTPTFPLFYVVRVLDKDMNIITDPKSPIWMYDAESPNRRVYGCSGGSMWTALHYRKYLLKDGKKIICDFGGEWIVRTLPYRSVTKGDKL